MDKFLKEINCQNPGWVGIEIALKRGNFNPTGSDIIGFHWENQIWCINFSATNKSCLWYIHSITTYPK